MHERHGLVRHPLYVHWRSMRNRCAGSSDSVKKRQYKDRGIVVCAAWDSFPVFFEWALNNGWELGKTLDRIDPNGNYEPNNCRWATNLQQGEHKTNSRNVTIDGVTLHVREWARRTGISPRTLYSRYEKGITGRQFIAPPEPSKAGRNHARKLKPDS